MRLSRLGPHLCAAATALSLIAPVSVYLVHLAREQEADLLAQAELQAATHARLLEHVLARAAAAPRLLLPTIGGAVDSARADEAARMLELAGPVSALDLVPVDGTRLRLDAAAHSDPRGLASLPPLEPVGAPVLSMRDGAPLVEQRLVALDGGVARPWGIAAAHLTLERLLAEARLADLAPEGFGVRLLYRHDERDAARLLHGDGEASSLPPAGETIALPGGGLFRLEVMPARGRLHEVPLLAGAVLLLSAVLSYLLTLRLLRRPSELQREVARHTRLLQAEKLVLEEEIGRRTAVEALLERSHALLDSIFEQIPEMIVLKGVGDQRIARINRSGEHFLGRPRELLLGLTDEDVYSPEVARVLAQGDREALLAHGPVELPVQRLELPGQAPRWVLMRKLILRDRDGLPEYLLEFGEDVSERERLNRMLRVLSETNQAIARADDADALLARVGVLLRKRGGFPCAWLHLTGADGLRMMTDPNCGDLPQRVTKRVLAPEGACLPEAWWYGLASECCGAELAQEIAERGLSALVHLPLFSEGRCVGGIGLLTCSSRPFTGEEQQLLEELGANLSFALDALARDGRRRRAEEKLQLAARVFENSAEGIMVTDACNLIVMVNKAFTQVTGYTSDEVIGQNPRLLSSGRQSTAFYRGMWQALQTRGEWHGEIENRRKNGEFYPEWLTISVVRNDAGEVTHHVAVFSDLTARKQIEQRLDFLAHYDALTALPNRVLFTDRLQQALAKAKSDGQRVAVAFLDLDRFQIVNETIGHAVGDRLLQELSRRFTGAIRPQDSVSRLGGDEFALIFGGLASADEAVAHVGRMQQMLNHPVSILEHEIHCSASIGVAVYPDDGDDADVLAKNADSAMYKAMEDGGNTVRFFHQDMNQRSAARIKLEGKLHHALERGELMVYYQPLVSATSGRIVGAEALLRWQRSDLGGLVSPAAFVPLLEETGLILPVGEWVLRTACEENRRWRALTGEELFVAVNLSAVQLGDAELPEKVRRLLDETAFDSRYLEIELTESSVMRDPEAGIRALRELKALGLRISVDDFGTGYSSLSYLKRLPLDTLKVDRSFVHDTPDDAESVSLTRAIIAMGHSLHLEIIAEGVEKPAQAAFLREIGCDILQGYNFSPAVPAERFRALLVGSNPYPLPCNGSADAGCGAACRAEEMP